MTWNIGGGKIYDTTGDPSKIASYTQDGFEHIAAVIAREKPDVIALQETQKNDTFDLARQFADKLGYPFYVHDSTSPSHFAADCKLGHAILSKFPISEHSFVLFDNPKLEVIWEDGSIAKSFDKGYSTATLLLDTSTMLRVSTTHLVPFRRFGLAVDSEVAKLILRNVDDLIVREENPWVVLGDFNIDSTVVAQFFPKAFHGMSEVALQSPTTPDDHMYDHVLYDGLRLIESQIIANVLTDHYPVLTTFEL